MNLTEQSRLMLFAPHPCDETLAAGGLLQSAQTTGAAICVVFATDGEGGSCPQRGTASRSRANRERVEQEQLGSRRREQALTALDSLGISRENALFWGCLDLGVTELLVGGDQDLRARLDSQIKSWGPTLIVIPSIYDIHPDHSALGVLVNLACLRLDPERFEFDVLTYILYESAYGLTAENIIERSLSPEQQDRKFRALSCHSPQFKVSRRKLRRIAARPEQFFSQGPASREVSCHPIRSALTSFTSLRLNVATKSSLGAFGRRTLWFIGQGTKDEQVRMFMDLPKKSGESRVYDAAEKDEICKATICGRGQHGDVQFPSSSMPQLAALYVKVKRRFGAFDEAGWREVPILGSVTSSKAIETYVQNGAGRGLSLCCVMPCFNVSGYCREVVDKAVSLCGQLVLINDGSTDETGEILQEAAAEYKGRVRIISLMHNRGKGVALLTGFRYALEKLPFDVMVTLDANGLHDPAEISRFVETITNEDADLVLGQRTFASRFTALRPRLGNKLFASRLRKMYPSCPYDSCCGFRAIKKSFLEEIVSVVRGGRYETELHILMLALERRRQIVTLPIEITNPGNRAQSHFRPLADGFRMYRSIRVFRAGV